MKNVEGMLVEKGEQRVIIFLRKLVETKAVPILEIEIYENLIDKFNS